MFPGVAERPIFHLVFSLLMDQSVVHFEWSEHTLAEEFAIRFSRNLGDNKAQNDITGVTVRPACSWSELSALFFFQKFQDFGVLNLFFRRPPLTVRSFRSFHQVFVIGQAGSVIEEVSNGDRFSVNGK